MVGGVGLGGDEEPKPTVVNILRGGGEAGRVGHSGRGGEREGGGGWSGRVGGVSVGGGGPGVGN